MLAKLFTKPFNLLVMDEPTNDLDVETLELLEELLMDYEGTLILVSHDRAFVDNVVTSTLVYEGDARVNEYVGGYEDWLRQYKNKQSKIKPETVKKETKEKPIENNVEAKKKPKKLSFNDQRELDALPKLIEDLDAEQEELTNKMASAEFYQQDKDLIAATTQRLGEVEAEQVKAYERWEELEGD